MIEGNTQLQVSIKKSRLAIQVAMNTSLKELASEYNLSINEMKRALQEAGFWKHRGTEKEIEVEETKKSKLEEASEKFEITSEKIAEIIEFMGLKLKEEKTRTKSRKFVIVDDITNNA